MEKWEQMEKPLRDLMEIIRFTEDVSAKIPGLLDEAEIYRTVMDEFAQSKRYTASILLLTEDASSLRIVETSLPPEQAREGEKAAGVRLKGYRIDLNKSSIYRQVVREGKTLQVNVSDVIGELFPRPLAYLISKAMGYEKKPCILTPLKRHGEIIGAFAMTSSELAEHLIPSVRNLARHISAALELAEEYAERVWAEEALRESEQWLSTTLRSIGDAVIATDAQGLVSLMNPVAEELTAWNEAEAVGQPLEDVFNIINERTGERAENPVARVLREGVVVGLANHTVLIAKDGTKRPIADSGAPMEDEDGNIIGTVMVFRDITERRRVEDELREHREHLGELVEKRTAELVRVNEQLGREIAERKRAEGALVHERDLLQALMDNIPDTIYFKDTASRFTRINRAQAQVLGIKDPEEATGKTDFDFFTEEHAQDAYADEQEIVKSGQPLIDKVERIRRADGQVRWVSATKVPIMNGKGQVTGIVGISRDITERRRAEEALRASEQKYRRLVEDSIDGIAIVQEAETRFVNRALLEMFGCQSEDQMVGHPFTDFVSPEYRTLMVERGQAREKGEDGPSRYEFKALRKDGTEFDAELSVGSIDYQGSVARQGIIRDITERKRAEEALRESEERYRTLFEGVPVGLYRTTSEGKILDANPALVQMLDYPDRQALLKADAADVFVNPEDRRREQALLEREGIVRGFEVRLRQRDGSAVWVQDTVRAVRDAEGRVLYYEGSLEDITDRKQAEEALRRSEQFLQEMFDAIQDGISVLDTDFNVIRTNHWMQQMYAHQMPLSGRKCYRVYQQRRSPCPWCPTLRTIETEETYTEIVPYPSEDNPMGWIELTAFPIKNEQGHVTNVIEYVKDITNRKRAEEEVQRRVAQAALAYEVGRRVSAKLDLDELLSEIVTAVRDAFDYYGVMILLVDEEAQCLTMQSIEGGHAEMFPVDLSHAIGAGMTGYAAASGETQISGDVSQGPHYVREADEETKSELAVPIKSNEQVIGVLDIQSDEFDAFDETNVMAMETLTDQIAVAIENARLYEAVEQELTKRKRAEEALRESREALRKTFESITDGVSVINLNGIITEVNHGTMEMHGFSSKDELLGRSAFELVAPRDHERIAENMRQAIKQGTLRGIEYTLLKADGSEFPGELSTSVLKDASGNLVGHVTIARDITERKRAQAALQQSHAKLQRALEGTIHTLGSAVEIRDPYTAGHQRRVSQLACAIAEELGLSKDQREGLRMAGLIHDLGKINVPADILSKPGRLNEIEFGLIKMHPQVGHDILKTAEFPWPVAQMVLQHHERMDGSGYPQGLLGEEIILEAKILAVADVVEAMASHRPYRPAHSIDETLEEISQNRGVLYDPEVVDACLKLFTEKGFMLG